MVEVLVLDEVGVELVVLVLCFVGSWGGGCTKLPRLALWYQPTLFASTFISRRHLTISAWYQAFAFARGAAAAAFAALLSLKSPVEAAGSADGNGNELVTWSSPSTSIPAWGWVG